MKNDNSYFALKPTDEIGLEIEIKISEYYNSVLSNGWVELWRKSYMQYYRGMVTGASILRGGDAGELTRISVNHYRNLIRHILTMTTNQKSVFEPRAINNDYKSMAQTILAQNLLDYYIYQERINRDLDLACEYGIVFGEGYVIGDWDASIGKEIGTIEAKDADGKKFDKPIAEGDLSFTTSMPLDVIRDANATKQSAQRWYIIRTFVSKYDYMALYPDKENEISGIQSEVDSNRLIYPDKTLDRESDQIPLYTLYHKKSAAVPEGRMVRCFNAKTVLTDTALPFKNFPVFRITPGEQAGTNFGYSDSFDLLAIQKMHDVLNSTIASNQSTFGVQNIVIEKGTSLGRQSLSGQLNLLTIPKGGMIPQPLNLTKTPPEIFNFKEQLTTDLETMSGVNSVTRGQPEASLRSGSALALVQSMAVEYNSYLQKSYAELMEDVGTFIITTLQENAATPRVSAITGKSNRAYMKEWKGSDLSDIDKVIVDVGNALAKTIAGRTEMAQNLLQNGMVKNPQQFIQVMQTGRLEPVIEGEQAELMLIKDENERMMAGEQTLSISTDDHRQHILEHKVVAANTEARKDGKLMKILLEHIDGHIKLLQTTDPFILMALQQEPIMPPPPQGAQAPPSKQNPNNMGAPKMPEIPQQ